MRALAAAAQAALPVNADTTAAVAEALKTAEAAAAGGLYTHHMPSAVNNTFNLCSVYTKTRCEIACNLQPNELTVPANACCSKLRCACL